MHLAYLDESYSASRYFIAALLIPCHQARSLTEDLDGVVNAAATGYGGVPSDTELHGHDLFQGTGAWEPLKTKLRARIGVYAQALKAISAYDVAVVLRGVDRIAQERRYSHLIPPHNVVLEHTLERLNDFAEQKGDDILVMADEIPGAAGHQRDLSFYQRKGTTGYRSRKLSRIVDTIYFAPSTASRLLQAADLVAYLHHRIQVSGWGADARASGANKMLWSHIQSKIHHEWLWVP